MPINIGNISAGRDVNIAEGNITLTLQDFHLEIEKNKELEQPIKDLNKAIEKKDTSAMNKAIDMIGKISIPALTTVASKLALKVMGL